MNTNTEFFRKVNTFGTTLVFSTKNNTFLSNDPELTTLFYCPVKRVGWVRYKDDYSNAIYAMYAIDWRDARGREIPGTNLQYFETVSCNNLADATISCLAINKEKNKVVSVLFTSYWVSDKDDVKDWKHDLLQKHCNEPVEIL